MQGQDLHVDETCLRTWWKNGLFQITIVDKNITGLNHEFFNAYFVPTYTNCFGYTGPYPP